MCSHEGFLKQQQLEEQASETVVIYSVEQEEDLGG
jgi:hypothetical protein